MRRQKTISVRVRAPSRGLVSRLPGESADQFPRAGTITPGQLQQAASKASNVRYENGVVCNAPGYERVGLSSGLLDGLLAAWHLDEISGTRVDASGNGRNLTAVDGFDPYVGTLIVGEETGKFSGAALFNSLSFRILVSDSLTLTTGLSGSGSFYGVNTKWNGDLVSLSAGIDESFQNPRIQWGLDSATLTDALDGGIYFAAAVVTSPTTDSSTITVGMDSGSYTAVVVSTSTTPDSATISVGLDILGGSSYVKVIGATETVTDSGSITAGVDGGYVNTFKVTSASPESMTLTAGLDSGSYA